MTDYEIKLPKDLLSSLMAESTGFAQLLGSVLNQVLEAQATEQIGADRYERSADRGGGCAQRCRPLRGRGARRFLGLLFAKDQ